MNNKIDLHTHSVLSRHAYSSLTENIEYAASIGLEVYGISEHQPDEFNVGAHKYVFNNCMRIAPKEYNNTKILVGIEMNVSDGDFNTYGIKVDELSYCIASMHAYAYSPKHTYEENTDNYIKALYTPYISFLGHLDYPIFPCNYKKIIKAAKDCDKIIELNNASLDPNGSRKGARDIDKEILSYCMEYNVPIIMNSDAHIKFLIGNVDYCVELLEEVNFPKELVINYNTDLFNKYFKYR